MKNSVFEQNKPSAGLIVLYRSLKKVGKVGNVLVSKRRGRGFNGSAHNYNRNTRLKQMQTFLRFSVENCTSVVVSINVGHKQNKYLTLT